MKRLVLITAAAFIGLSAYAQQALFGGASAESPVINPDGTTDKRTYVVLDVDGAKKKATDTIQKGKEKAASDLEAAAIVCSCGDISLVVKVLTKRIPGRCFSPALA